MKKTLLFLFSAFITFGSLQAQLQESKSISPDGIKSGSTTTTAGTTERFPMFETFTSSTCPPCTPANVNMEGIFSNNPGDHVSLKYQMSWPGTGDPYYTTEGGVRRNYYNVSSVPNVAIDGGWNTNGNSLTQSVYDFYKNKPSVVQMQVLFNITGQTVCVDVDIDPLDDVNVNDLKLFVAIKENLTTQNVKTNGETEFVNVMKKLLPDWTGQGIPALVNGQHVKYSMCYTFKGNYRLPVNAASPIDHASEHSVEEFSDLSVAAWIQRKSTKEVYQAAEGQFVMGIDDFNPETHNLLIYPNPTAGNATVSVDMARNEMGYFDVINTMGQTVLKTTQKLESGTNKVKLNTAGLTAGLYFVKVEIAGKAQVLKLTIQ